MSWPRRTILKIKEKIKEGTKFFIDHGNNTNSHEDRKSVGEIVKNITKEIGGKLSNIIIGHFPDESQVKDMDVCSMEAEVLTDASNTVEDVSSITAVALGSSDKDSPAFPGALRLASVQCFEKEDDPGEGDKKPGDGGNQMPVTFAEVKTFIKEHNVWPNQIYTEETLRNDNVFGKVFSEKDSLQTENKTLKDSSEGLTKKITEIETDGKKKSAKDRLVTFIPEGVTKKQKDFIESSFDPEKVSDLSDEGLKSYITSSQADFQKFAKVFGSDNKDSNDSDNSGSDDNTEGSSVEEALKELGVENG
ncbi:hypothetical protein KAR91_47450 [Candidatus Pacearchaeota archaeon]|nr:hypothetical protein [Candidatus Pacearchaeota archaeon]